MTSPTATPAADPPQTGPARSALESLFVETESGLLRLAFAVTGDATAAQDIVQEAFLRLIPRHAGIVEPRAWLVTAVRRLALDHRRRRKPAVSPETLERLPADAPATPPGEHAEAVAALRLLMGDLPPRDREILKLRFEDDLDYAGIANRTGMSVGNVGFRLHHTLKRLGVALRRRA